MFLIYKYVTQEQLNAFLLVQTFLSLHAISRTSPRNHFHIIVTLLNCGCVPRTRSPVNSYRRLRGQKDRETERERERKGIRLDVNGRWGNKDSLQERVNRRGEQENERDQRRRWKGEGGRKRTGPPCYIDAFGRNRTLFLFLILAPASPSPRHSAPLFHSLFRFEPAPATLLCTESFRDRTAIGPLLQWCSSNPTSAGPFRRAYIDICIYTSGQSLRLHIRGRSPTTHQRLFCLA